MFAVQTELQEASELLLRQEQHNFYHCEIKTLEIGPQVKPHSILKRLYRFLHENFCLWPTGRN